MSVYLLFAMRLGRKCSRAKGFRELLCVNSFRALILFIWVSSAFVYVTKYSSMGLRPSMAQKSDM